MRTTVSALAMVAVVAGLGCTRPNPDYCDELSDCKNGLVCDLNTHGCVAPDADISCSSNEECTDPLAPICADQVCRGCTLDDECASGVCRADGACEAATAVLYAAPNAPASGDCSSSSPCDLFYARSLVTSQRHAIRLANGTYAFPTTFNVAPPISEVQIVGGRGAIVERGSTGTSFSVSDGALLSVRGVALHRGIECTTAKLDLVRVVFESPGTEVRA